MVFDAAFWATIALFIFIGVIVYLKVPGMITKALDGRIKAIEGDFYNVMGLPVSRVVRELEKFGV